MVSSFALRRHWPLSGDRHLRALRSPPDAPPSFLSPVFYRGRRQAFPSTGRRQNRERGAFFRHFRYRPSPGEVNSWRNSLRAVSQVFQASDLLDHGVILEYQLPLTSRRLDCLVCGRDDDGADEAVIIELKQWDKCSPAIGERLVTTWVGGAQWMARGAAPLGAGRSVPALPGGFAHRLL